MRPSRNSDAGRAYLDLQNQARRDGRPTDELLTLYALEGFLDRLASSPLSSELVLKGGVLLAAFDSRRPTRDIDLQAQALVNDTATVLALVREIAAIEREDGLVYDYANATAETIRDEDEYSGVRVNIVCQLSRAHLSLHVDVNVGDPIWPTPQTVEVPRLLGGVIEIRGYPLTMVHAEKIVTALQRGVLNTRWRDFADIYVLTSTRGVTGVELRETLRIVADHRAVVLRPLTEALQGYAEQAQARWAAWRRKQRLDHVPESFAELLEAVFGFADPALRGEVDGLVWLPGPRAWSGGGPKH